MLESLSLVILVGWSMGEIINKLKCPRIIGMIISGIVLGPYVLNMLDSSLLDISDELRQIALIIILLKAGITLDLSDLKKVGRPAMLIAFLPASFEILAYFIFAPIILKIPRIEALVMGAVLSAVSPAVVVPRMVNLIEKKYGTDKAIPQMVLAGSSLDDIYVIVLFTSFLNLAKGKNFNFLNLIDVPVSILLGIIIGALIGYILSEFFKILDKNKNSFDNSVRVFLIMGIAFGLIAIEKNLEKYISISGLLAILTMACIIRIKSDIHSRKSISAKIGKLWIAAEVFLFVLVGAAVDIRYTFAAGYSAIIMILIALLFRSIGVFISIMGTGFTNKEKLFCVIAYLPKATVQAAIGAIPLSMGLASGKIILSVAVLGIFITAPLGAFLLDTNYKSLLNHDI